MIAENTLDATMAMVKKTMNLENLENENANLAEQVFSARNVRVANNVTKQYAMDELLSGDVRRAFQDNWIYIHDFNAYASGNHNCLTLDLAEVLKSGFKTNNADIREPNSISSAMQLTAVIMQCQSNLQFGGIAAGTLDIDLAPFVEKSFANYYREGMNYIYEIQSADEPVHFLNNKSDYPSDHPYRKACDYAWDKTVEETHQGAEAMIHNLNSLQSRAADQLPFTSINYGTDTSPCGRLVTKSILNATMEGIGKHHLTPIFPVQVFQYFKGINDRPGTPNYDLFRLAMKCSALRMFPNYANCTASYFKKPTCKEEIFNTMGCRTQISDDRFGIKGNQGRGNISPVTINLAKIGIENGICLDKRVKPDIDGFWSTLDRILQITAKALVERFDYQGRQPAKSAPFMYENQLMKGRKLSADEPVREVLKHGTLAIGLIGLANCMSAMFGKHQFEDEDVWNFAYSVYQHVADFKNAMSEKYDLNFSVYSTPAENCCYSINQRLVREYGEIKGVTDRGYLTNSFHCPVWYPISAEEKIRKEAPFHKLSRGGAITYVEVDSSTQHNIPAMEQLVNDAMAHDISYFAMNVQIDTCRSCSYQGLIDHTCPKCGSSDIERLRRITGYLTGSVERMNIGKQKEVADRVKHTGRGHILFDWRD
ncbi:anaerobic ribonucleoside-triphosphate reductase [Sporolactobacillus vineae]|uniref:anaerobic ribonucleoside-triphosphate reductase n=1 Tax=Sporolactobacillus vineae TaxID=444463 RepID=UPI000288BD77|nr:anaerobic ribonucleoside-triphosphate reductase [Sporolactobacillus vineae]